MKRIVTIFVKTVLVLTFLNAFAWSIYYVNNKDNGLGTFGKGLKTFSQFPELLSSAINEIIKPERLVAIDTSFKEINNLENRQMAIKILLNSLYGATALPNFRYGMNDAILSEAITLSGHRIIQESALCANKHMNKIIKGELKLEI